MGALLLAVAPLQARDEQAPPTISGPVYYGEPVGATRIAEVAIRLVYAENPAFMRLRALGLSESDGGRGQALFDAAQSAAKRALARVASAHNLQVIAELGSVQGASNLMDRTREVIDELPQFYVEGKVLHGNARNARELAEVDSLAVLMAIPSFVEAQGLDESNARFHILQKDYQDRFAAAMRKIARDSGLDSIVEKGAATSRFGAILDVTQQAIQSLGE
ncbi:MAG: hypothetical protein DHS20C15_14630 [Planctomycetota bacterium]|nr:MAG: hypothetical protein DHS20C15_14630 [Planctomycetota bacterium]